MSKNETTKPWLNQKGELLPDSEIKEICRTWGPQVWSEYLKNYESDQTELFANDLPVDVEEHMGNIVEFYRTLLNQEQYPLLKKVIHIGLSSLSPREREVIIRKYWEGMNISEISRDIDLARKSVSIYHDRALSKLGSLLVSGAISQGILFLKTVERTHMGRV